MVGNTADSAGLEVGVVAELAFGPVGAFVVHAEGFAQADEFFGLAAGDGEELATFELGSDPDGLAVRLDVFHFPIGVFDVFAPGDDAVVDHEHGHVIDGSIANHFSIGRRAGRAVFRHADLTKEDFRFGDHAGWRLHASDGEGSAVWWVRVAASLGLRLAFHDGKVGHALGSALVFACELRAFHIHEAHLFKCHETFTNKSWRAKHEVVADADGEVAAIAIGVFAGPHALADIDHALLDLDDRGRVEEGGDFRWSFRVFARSPVIFVVRKNGFGKSGWSRGGGAGTKHRAKAIAQHVFGGWGENRSGWDVSRGFPGFEEVFDIGGGEDFLAHGIQCLDEVEMIGW